MRYNSLRKVYFLATPVRAPFRPPGCSRDTTSLRVAEERGIFFEFRSALGDQHRLQQILITSQAKQVISPSTLKNPFLLQVHAMGNVEFRAVMELAAGGAVDTDRCVLLALPMASQKHTAGTAGKLRDFSSSPQTTHLLAFIKI